MDYQYKPSHKKNSFLNEIKVGESKVYSKSYVYSSKTLKYFNPFT